MAAAVAGYGSVVTSDVTKAIKGASTSSSIINLVNTIIGAGILAMPYAYKANGVLLGTIIILFSGLASSFGLYLQGLSATYLAKGQNSSFNALAKITYPSLAFIFDVAIAVKCFGVGVSYIIIIGDLMPQVSQSIGLSAEVLLERKFWVTVSMAIVGPLSFLRKLDSLKYTSVVALVSVGYLVVIVIIHYFIGDTLDQRGPVRIIEPQSFLSVISALPVVVFAFTCHQNMFSVLNELTYISESRVRKIIGLSVGTAAIFYMAVGLCGYLSFGENVGGNIIGEYNFSVFSTIGRIAIVLLVVFSYPLQCHPCRISCSNIFRSCAKKLGFDIISQEGTFTPVSRDEEGADGSSLDSHSSSSAQLGSAEFLTVTLFILILSYITVLSVHSLELMLAFVGATGSTSISFILPGLFGYSLLGKSSESLLYQENIEHIDLGSKKPLVRNLSLGLVIWGILVSIVCFSLNIYRLFVN